MKNKTFITLSFLISFASHAEHSKDISKEAAASEKSVEELLRDEPLEIKVDMLKANRGHMIRLSEVKNLEEVGNYILKLHAPILQCVRHLLERPQGSAEHVISESAKILSELEALYVTNSTVTATDLRHPRESEFITLKSKCIEAHRKSIHSGTTSNDSARLEYLVRNSYNLKLNDRVYRTLTKFLKPVAICNEARAGTTMALAFGANQKIGFARCFSSSGRQWVEQVAGLGFQGGLGAGLFAGQSEIIRADNGLKGASIDNSYDGLFAVGVGSYFHESQEEMNIPTRDDQGYARLKRPEDLTPGLSLTNQSDGVAIGLGANIPLPNMNINAKNKLVPGKNLRIRLWTQKENTEYLVLDFFREKSYLENNIK